MATVKDLGELQIKSKIARNWLETKDEFIADNLSIYYKESTNEWKLKDKSTLSTIDLTTIKIPLNYIEVARIKRICIQKHIAD